MSDLIYLKRYENQAVSEDRFRVRIRVDSIFDGVLIAICLGDVVWEMVGNL